MENFKIKCTESIINTRNWKAFTSWLNSKASGSRFKGTNVYAYYGVLNNRPYFWLAHELNDIPTITLSDWIGREDIAREQLLTTFGKVHSINTVKQISITRVIGVNGAEREVTIYVEVDQDGQLYGGYSVRNPTDKENKVLAVEIAKGRAVSPRSNLLKLESITYELRTKHVLKGIANSLFSQISKGDIQIKGVK